jgi:hypothetical protein
MRVTDVQFVAAWATSFSVDEVAKKTGLSVRTVWIRADRLRADGVELPDYYADLGKWHPGFDGKSSGKTVFEMDAVLRAHEKAEPFKAQIVEAVCSITGDRRAALQYVFEGYREWLKKPAGRARTSRIL